MKQTSVVRPHGGVRGADLSRSSILFSGPFGRIFRALPPADFGANDMESEANLSALATKMITPLDPTDPKDGPDDEESGIPAAYTYLGQFIDHDLTFDPASSLQKQNDPDALVDYRTPRFDLDNVYGRGPEDQPYMYDGATRKFLLGKPLSGAPDTNKNATDLPRSGANPARAIIGDPRNDENSIVSQLQGLFHRFHNAVVDANLDWTFSRVQQEVRFHYQWMLVHDFLPTIVAEGVLEPILPGSRNKTPEVEKISLRFFHPRDEAFMPLEFSAAAYRFGHSMVRPGYRLNDGTGPQRPIAIFAADQENDLRGFRDMPADWAIDWRRFIDLEPLPYGTIPVDGQPVDPDNKNRLQLAYKIDTALVNPLSLLPASVSSAPPRVPPTPGAPVPPNVLAELNLRRGWRMRLPSGQSIAKAMGLIPLMNDQILIGKFTGDPNDKLLKIVTISEAFRDNCPLWTYVLAETIESSVSIKVLQKDMARPDNKPIVVDKKISTRKLGPVGGTIVAETFLGLLKSDSSSYLNLDPLWKPTLAIDGVFGLRELIAHALVITIKQTA